MQVGSRPLTAALARELYGSNRAAGTSAQPGSAAEPRRDPLPPTPQVVEGEWLRSAQVNDEAYRRVDASARVNNGEIPRHSLAGRAVHAYLSLTAAEAGAEGPPPGRLLDVYA